MPLVDTWDADLFLRFEAERARPARDFVARIESSPSFAVDLGCGPGSSTRLLAERFPDARVVGVDSSARMLAEARRRLPGFAFEEADIAQWRPERPPDLIFANGALEWVPDHQALFPRLMAQLADGGTLAVQMPDTTQEPTHALMRLIAADGPWSDRLVPIAKTRAVIAPYTDYYNWLRPHAASLHGHGYRNFETRDKSTNNALIAVLAWGEGWHNNIMRPLRNGTSAGIGGSSIPPRSA